IYPDVQLEIVAYAAKNRIPIISPLASQTNITETNSSYFQVNPSREYLTQQTAEMVAEEHYNSNLIILKTSDYNGTPEGELVELLREKFFNSGLLSSNEGVNFTIYDFQNEGAFGLRRIMSKNKENVVYIPSSNEGELSVAISNVNNLAEEHSITLIGTNRYPNYSSIQIEHYHNLKLKFIAPYHTDYTNPKTIAFIEKYKNNFATEPNNFGFQGYDVTMYFLTALLAYGNDFTDCLPYMHTFQTQGNYHFNKLTQFGGYMNEGVSVISYTRDYEVKRKRIKGQPRLITASGN
ncbi:MAG TPA: ABC transporter substrate-binding protein, partial [Draconibacterium sp.]|nr:ABC transporter substrate-binding protein [Draconibacterium sp.]